MFMRKIGLFVCLYGWISILVLTTASIPSYTTAPIYASVELNRAVVAADDRVKVLISLIDMATDARRASSRFEYVSMPDPASYSIYIMRVIACVSDDLGIYPFLPFRHDVPASTGCYSPGTKRTVLLDARPRNAEAMAAFIWGDADTQEPQLEPYVTATGAEAGLELLNATLTLTSKPLFWEVDETATDNLFLQTSHDRLRGKKGHETTHGDKTKSSGPIQLQIFWKAVDIHGQEIVPENRMKRNAAATYGGGLNAFQSIVQYHVACPDGYVANGDECVPPSEAAIPTEIIVCAAFVVITAVVIVKARQTANQSEYRPKNNRKGHLNTNNSQTSIVNSFQFDLESPSTIFINDEKTGYINYISKDD